MSGASACGGTGTSGRGNSGTGNSGTGNSGTGNSGAASSGAASSGAASSGAARVLVASSMRTGVSRSPSTTPSWFSLRALTRTRLSSEPTVWL